MNNKLEMLSKLPLLTYGTTLGGAYYKFLKLTNSVKSDKQNGRSNSQSMNQGDTSLIHAIYYIPTVRQRSLALHSRKGKNGQFFSSAHLKHHIMQCPCILVWLWDNKYTLLWVNGKLYTLPVSEKYADKHNLESRKDIHRYSPTDTEVILESKDLRPEPAYVILGKDIIDAYSTLINAGYNRVIHLPTIQKLFFPDSKQKMRFIIANHRLMISSITDFERYISHNRNLEYELRLVILKDLLRRVDIPREWRETIKTIRKFMENK